MRQAKADAELTLSTLPATANSFSHGEILVVTVVTIALMHLDMHLSTKKQSAEFHPLISILSIASNKMLNVSIFLSSSPIYATPAPSRAWCRHHPHATPSASPLTQASPPEPKRPPSCSPQPTIPYQSQELNGDATLTKRPVAAPHG